jgi:hypothetical protein
MISDQSVEMLNMTIASYTEHWKYLRVKSNACIDPDVYLSYLWWHKSQFGPRIPRQPTSIIDEWQRVEPHVRLL